VIDHRIHLKFPMMLMLAILLLGWAVIGCGDNGSNHSGEEAELQAGKWGFIDKNGNWVIEPRFASADSFSEGLARAGVDDKAAFIDKTGNWAIEPQYDPYQGFSEGLAPVAPDLMGPYGYIDKTGDIVIDLRFDFAGSFNEGRAIIVKEEKHGFIDTEGNVVVEPRFSRAYDYSEGLAAVRI
jgi:hypothetical protein